MATDRTGLDRLDTFTRACAHMLWALAWADEMENQGRSGEMSGQDIFDIMPPVPALAFVESARIVAEVETRNECPMYQIFARARDAAMPHAGKGTADLETRFGECLAYMYLGHGVSWYDDYPEFTVPARSDSEDSPFVMPRGESCIELCDLASEIVSATRPLDLAACQVSLTIDPDDSDIAGNFSSGDPELDAETVREIKARLASGDEWAWCMVTVTVTDGEHTGTDTLGACSYESESDFRKCPYYADMVASALAELNALRAKGE